MRVKKFSYYVADFETTVYKEQARTDVWAAAFVPFYTEDVVIKGSIEDFMEHVFSLEGNLCIYFHNLKFDGSFILSWLLNNKQFKQATLKDKDGSVLTFDKERTMPNNSFKYSISDRGQWYTIHLKQNKRIIEFRDSLKLLPFSVKRLGSSFKTKHQKLEMEYTGFRYPNCPRTEEEDQYIANDVLVVKEALEIAFEQGHNKLTIGSCCLSEYKTITGKKDYEEMFPNLYEIKIDEQMFGQPTAGDYILKSYHGGWCYVAKGKENQIKHGGITADVNSLYPSMMSSESGNRYPIGRPQFWKGNFIPDLPATAYYFIRIKTRFHIKHNMLPTIQIKGNPMYKGTEWLETSDIWSERDHCYKDAYYNIDDVIVPARLEMTMTMTDYQLFRKHYGVCDFEILDGCWFNSAIGIFDDYIEKYKNIKLVSTGAVRELAKLFLNNLYGKMASSTDSSFKVAYLRDDGSLGYYIVSQHDKKPGYIAVGSAITSYARNFTITAAQKNYYGPNKRGFIYADTDSIHCDLKPEELQGVPVHDKNFCHWKLEATWDEAIFARQKTYIEHVVAENLLAIDKPYYNVKCAGMPEKCKKLFILSMERPEDMGELDERERKFVETKRGIEDFKVGLSVPGKLRPVNIPGGVLLVDTPYVMR